MSGFIQVDMLDEQDRVVPIWVNPTAVIVMEADTVASVRLVLTNGGYIRVVGQPAQVMVSLSESRTFREDR
jgi:hypothetical protein